MVGDGPKKRGQRPPMFKEKEELKRRLVFWEKIGQDGFCPDRGWQNVIPLTTSTLHIYFDL